jgi:cytochrome c-type biogenesis protein CcmF
MISLFGHISTLTALFVALGGASASIYGGWTKRSELVGLGEGAAWIVFTLIALACGLMIDALVTHDFSVKYVADVGSRQTPLYYTVISLWGALEGSILFWGFILSLYTVAVLMIHRMTHRSLIPFTTGILLAISSFFLFIMSGPANPFIQLSNPPANGPGPNPLLQNHPMMGLHPPLLYLGYVGLSVPFAIVLGGLLARIRDRRAAAPVRPLADESLVLARKWALVSWCFLTLGIIAGMWWSYDVLGWGGYWSWDPVENAVLMPWLVTTAFLHSFQVRERRNVLHNWTVSLIISAFCLSILGTFLTRSGVLASVHSFTESTVGPFFLGFLALVLVVSIVAVVAGSYEPNEVATIDAVASRESAFLLNNLFLVLLTCTVLLGTLYPLIAEAFTGQVLSVGGPFFDNVAIPIAAAIVFLMGVGPILPWGTSRLDQTLSRILVPVGVAVVGVIVLVGLGVRGSGPLALYTLVFFVAASTISSTWADVNVRRSNSREGYAEAFGRLVRSYPRRYGGYVAHLGVLLVLIGIASSQSFSSTATATLRAGQSMSVQGYRVSLAGVRSVAQPNRTVDQAVVNVTDGSRSLGTYYPSVNYYPSAEQPVITPAVRIGPWNDVYLAVRAMKPHWVTLQVYVKPLVTWIWFGGLVIALGAVAALLPARRRRSSPLAEAVVEGGEPADPVGAAR